ncbi:MAG TPA: histidine kinase [Longimicrobiaceae bacterium]|nr:histidine kinase [Longimicrobiaceae bacterium]
MAAQDHTLSTRDEAALLQAEYDFAREPAESWPAGPDEDARVGWRGFLLIVGFWTLYGAVMAANLMVSGFRETTPPTSLVAFTYLGAYAWAALTIPGFWLAARFSRSRAHPLARYASLFGIGLIVSLVVSLVLAVLSSYFLRQLLGGTLAGPQGIWEIARYRYMNDLLACLLIIAAGVAREYFLQYRARQAEANALRAQLVESRLEVLRAQLNPHFLFNTLNAVSALVAKDPRGVRRMIQLLSEMLRYTLDSAPEPEVTVTQELEMLERYLNILEIRFAGRLQTRIASAPEVRDALVPNLILQPLAENAMKHGVGRAGGHGRIDVDARREGEDVVLTVRDTGSGEAGPRRPEADGRSGGLGLRHTRERLLQLYGSASRLSLMKDPEGGTVAEVRIPFHLRTTLPSTTSQPAREATADA